MFCESHYVRIARRNAAIGSFTKQSKNGQVVASENDTRLFVASVSANMKIMRQALQHISIPSGFEVHIGFSLQKRCYHVFVVNINSTMKDSF